MKKKVILVQDNKDILDIMEDVLEEEGFEVVSSLTTKPIDEIEEINPNIVVIDDHITGNVKGSEIVKKLKEDPHTEDFPAILTSTSNDLQQKATYCKADDYIEKPFDLDHMVEVVKKNS